MPELHGNGIHEAYLAELFNPLAAGGQYNSGIASGIATGPQAPWVTQAVPQSPWVQPSSLGAQTSPAIQMVQQVAAKQAVQAIQLQHVLHALQQIIQTITVQQQHLLHSLNTALTQPSFGGPQYGVPQFGIPQFGTPQFGTPQFGTPQFGTPQLGTPQLGTPQSGIYGPYGVASPVNQILQQQAMQQLAQYLGVQQAPFRYGSMA